MYPYNIDLDAEIAEAESVQAESVQAESCDCGQEAESGQYPPATGLAASYGDDDRKRGDWPDDRDDRKRGDWRGDKGSHRHDDKEGHWHDDKDGRRPPRPGKDFDKPAPPFGPDSSMPPGRPPDITPRETPGVYAVDPGAIRGCLYNYVYIWLDNGQHFWMYPTYVGHKSISGYRWGYFGWVYAGYDLDNVESFFCAPR